MKSEKNGFRTNLYKNCETCWYFANTNCGQDNDLVKEDLSEIMCDGYVPNE